MIDASVFGKKTYNKIQFLKSLKKINSSIQEEDKYNDNEDVLNTGFDCDVNRSMLCTIIEMQLENDNNIQDIIRNK